MKPLILSYQQRTPAKDGIIEGYYVDDIRKLEAIVHAAANKRPIDRELTRLISDGVDLGVQSGKEITSLSRRLRALEAQLEEKDRRIAALEAPLPAAQKLKAFLNIIGALK